MAGAPDLIFNIIFGAALRAVVATVTVAERRGKAPAARPAYG